MDGLKGAVAESLKDTRINPALPCAGLTGEGFKSCMKSVNAEKATYKFSQDSGLIIYGDSNALDTRLQLAGVYSQSIFNENNLITALTNLAACRNNPADPFSIANRNHRLITGKLPDNQFFIDQVEGQQPLPTISTDHQQTDDDWLLSIPVGEEFVTGH